MDKGIVSGIHNYCDRWCERCFFTSRCAVYEDESDIPLDKKDLRNKAFWERLGDNFSKAKAVLEEAAKHYGVDLAVTQEEIKKSEEKQAQLRDESSNHPISTLSMEYSRFAIQWLKTQPGMLDRLENLKKELTLGVQSQEGAREETVMIKDSLAVIQWYAHFIHIKLVRALMGKLNEDTWDNKEHEDIPHDYDGSAKIALLAVDRSMQAWISLLQILPESEDDLLRILALLEKVKTLTLVEFPKAPAFVRPGFDET